MGDLRANNSRNLRVGNGRNIRRDSVRPDAYRITQQELQKRSADAFKAFAGDGGAAKIADALECNKATAKNYLEGRNVPSGIYDVRAYHAIPQYRALKRELAAMEENLDPRVQAKLAELYREMSIHGARLFGDGE